MNKPKKILHNAVFNIFLVGNPSPVTWPGTTAVTHSFVAQSLSFLRTTSGIILFATHTDGRRFAFRLRDLQHSALTINIVQNRGNGTRWHNAGTSLNMIQTLIAAEQAAHHMRNFGVSLSKTLTTAVEQAAETMRRHLVVQKGRQIGTSDITNRMVSEMETRGDE